MMQCLCTFCIKKHGKCQATKTRFARGVAYCNFEDKERVQALREARKKQISVRKAWKRRMGK